MKFFKLLFPFILLFLINSTVAQESKIKVLQQKFDSSLNKNDLQIWMKRLSAYPHPLGSSYNKNNAN